MTLSFSLHVILKETRNALITVVMEIVDVSGHVCRVCVCVCVSMSVPITSLHVVTSFQVHIEYHPGSSRSGTLMSGVIGSFPGGYSSDWSRDWSVPVGSVGGRLSVVRCVDIPSNMSLCRSIGYHQMMIPNLLHHDSMHEITQQSARSVS